MVRPSRTTICREGWCFLVVTGVLFAGAVTRDINVMMLLFGMMTGLFLYNWRSVSVALRNLEVERRLPARVEAGQLLEVEFEAVSRRRWGTWAVVVEDQLRRRRTARQHEPLQTARVLFPRLPSGKPRRASYRLRIEQCGRYDVGPLRLSTRFPFGLLRGTARQEDFASLIVYPKLGRLTSRWRTFQHGVHQSSTTADRRQGLLEGDFHGLRDWRSGDSRRWVHWRTSARRGQLMVKQFERHRNHDLAIILDLWQPKVSTPEHRRRIEPAQSFAATIVVDVCRRGGSHLLVATAAETPDTIRGAASIALLEELLELLAVAEPVVDDRLPEVLTSALDQARPGSTSILISTRSVDLADTVRFARIWETPRLQSQAARMIAIDTGAAALADYFQSEPWEPSRAG